ncbi:MAG: hypothetical protein IKH82_08040, partial [Clostridiales bacterium]|nr:hypothetical protein [Clostridiales bacterium]
GIYTIEETEPAPGYQLTDLVQEIVIRNGVTESFKVFQKQDDGTLTDVTDTAYVPWTNAQGSARHTIYNKQIIEIDKTMLGGEPVTSGKATFRLYAESETASLDNIDIEGKPAVIKTDSDGNKYIEFEGNAAKLAGLSAGIYRLEETAAPTGLKVIESAFRFEVKDVELRYTKVNAAGSSTNTRKVQSVELLNAKTDGDYTLSGGKITYSDGAEVETGQIKNGNVVNEGVEEVLSGETIKNRIIVADAAEEFHISKKELTSDGTEKDIDGENNNAKFTFSVKDENETLIGKTIGGVKITSETEGLSADKKSYTFTGNDTSVKGLVEGHTYILEETAAPEGYEKTTSTFEFTIKNGEVDKESVVVSTNGEYEVSEDGKTIKVLDKKTEINVSKKEFTADGNGKDIEGDGEATFKISVTNENETLIGKTIAGVTITSETEGLEDGGKSYKFTGNDTSVKGLIEGHTYTLEETVAPTGYDKTESSFDFTITDGKPVLVAAATNGEYKIADDGKTIIVLDRK